MKMDKESLAKNQFWIGFGIFVFLALIAVGWLTTASADANLQLKNQLDRNKAELEKKASKEQPRTLKDIAKLDDMRGALEKRKEEVWEQAWKTQEKMQSWPPDLEPDLGKLDFGADIKVDLRDKYTQITNYNPQLQQMADTFKTKVTVGRDTKTFDAVQFKDGWKNVIGHVDNWAAKNKAPTVEEVWLAQEDIWVQREVLDALREAIASVARFRKVEGPAASPGELFRQQFENSDWLLDLAVVQSKDGKYSLRGKIKNPEPRPDDPPTRRIKAQQKGIGTLYFQVLLHEGGTPVVMPVHGDTLAVGKEWSFAEVPLDLANRPDGILAVTQLYDTHTSPIRRIDQILIGQQPHRTFKPQLKMHEVSSPTAAAPAAGAAAKGPAGPTPALPVIERRRDGEGLNKTDYGLLRERYADVTKQVRRIPVALVLLVDQWYIPEIEAALANSRLRLQIAQVGWHHFRGTLTADVPDGGQKIDDKGRPTGKPRPAAAAAEDQQSNLVELKLYCVASLYERYKPSGQAAAKAEKAAEKTETTEKTE